MNTVLNPRTNFMAFRELIILLTRHRYLTLEMAKREISDRYAGQFFGIFWAFGHPLIQMLVYAFIFGVVFKVKIGGTVDLPRDYTTYIISGLIPWLAFQESMSKAATVIAGNANLVKQVVFPIESLPVKGVLSALFTEVVFLGVLTIYVLITFHSLPWTYLLLPVILGLQILAMIGVSYFLSATGVFFRDIKDLVQIFSVVGVYLMPAFYLPEFVPDTLKWGLYLNPFSYLIWCFQDVLYFGRIAHPWAWVVVSIASMGGFVAGYRYFRKLKILFGNVI